MVGSKRIARIKRKAKAVETARATVAKIAVGYVRVSTDEQASSGFGLATQEAAIRAFATSQGYELLEVVTDSPQRRGARPMQRPHRNPIFQERRGEGVLRCLGSSE
jgi:site-specific DNA recombinase